MLIGQLDKVTFEYNSTYKPCDRSQEAKSTMINTSLSNQVDEIHSQRPTENF